MKPIYIGMIAPRSMPLIPLDESTMGRWEDSAAPEKRLWANCLKEAIECLKGQARGCSSKERIQAMEDARRWFWSDRLAAGSFAWVCQLLGLDHKEIRSCLDDLLRYQMPEIGRARRDTCEACGKMLLSRDQWLGKCWHYCRKGLI